MIRKIGGHLSFAICLVGQPNLSANGQTVAPPLTSNRPGIGDSEALVGRKVVQVELGVEHGVSTSAEDSDRSMAWGGAVLRIGITDPVELFLSWDGLTVDRVSDEAGSRVVVGGNDLLLGSKLGVLKESRHRVTLTVAPSVTLPVGADDFSSGSYDGEVRLMWARTLPQSWAVSGNLVFVRTSDSAGRYWDNAVTTAVSRGLPSNTSAFVELVTALDEPRVWTVDGGVAWVSGTNVQWDFSAGRLVRGPESGWFVGAGITLRRLPRRYRTE